MIKMEVIEALTRSECTFTITWDEDEAQYTCIIYSKDKTEVSRVTRNSWEAIETNIQRRLMLTGADYWARITSKEENGELTVKFP